MEEVKKIINIVKKEAVKKAFKDVEIWFKKSSGFSVISENGEIKVSTSLEIPCIGLRVLKDRKIGYAGVTEISKTSIQLALSKAEEKMEKTYLNNFAEIKDAEYSEYKKESTLKLFDKPKIVQEYVKVLDEIARGQKHVDNYNIAISIIKEQAFVYTLSSDALIFWEETGAGGSVFLDSRDFEFETGREIKDWEKFLKKMEHFIKSYDKRTVKPEEINAKGREIEVIIHPSMLEGMLRNVFFEHLYITSVDEGYSRLKRGMRCAPEFVTIYDDGVSFDIPATSPCDDEGTSSQVNTVVEKGVVKTYLFDRETAEKHKTISTGNGMRRPILAEHMIEAPIRPTVRAVSMDSGKVSFSKMVKNTENGLLLKSLLGFHTANKVTGDFSNTVFSGYVISKGSIKGIVEPGAWGVKGNVFEILKNIKEISQERIITGKGYLPYVKSSILVI